MARNAARAEDEEDEDVRHEPAKVDEGRQTDQLRGVRGAPSGAPGLGGARVGERHVAADPEEPRPSGLHGAGAEPADRSPAHPSFSEGCSGGGGTNTDSKKNTYTPTFQRSLKIL